MIKYLENENLGDEIKEGIWLVDFYADWCGPCKALAPVLEDIDANIIKINVDTHEDLARKYGIMSIPTLCYFKDGELVKKTVGLVSKSEIESNLSNL